jgi:signal recognition particle subunit SRP54
MQNLGGVGSLMDKLPGMSQLPAQLKSGVGDRHTVEMSAIFNSMTPQERRFPDIIRGSRKRRIAGGSGTEVQAVNRLLKQHAQMKKMLKRLGKGGMKGMMKQLRGLQGQMPPGRF